MLTNKFKCTPLDYLGHSESKFFVLFFEKYNYNSQIIEDFSEIDDIKGIYKFNFIRCFPNGAIASKNISLVIDLDKCVFPIRIPLYWGQYVFESSIGTFKVKKDSTVKVIFASMKKKIYIKAPISILLILCQKHFNLADLNEEDIRTIGLYWESFLPLVFESKSFVTNNKYKDQAPYKLKFNLLLEKPVMEDFFKIIFNSTNHILMQYIEEIARLEIKNDVEKNLDRYFNWSYHYIRDKVIQDLHRDWIIKNDLRQNGQINDYFEYYDIDYGNRDKISTWNLLPIKFIKSPSVPFIDTDSDFKRLYLNSKNIQIRNIEIDLQKLNEIFPVFDFIGFYKEEFKKEIELINYNNGFFMFREKPQNRNEQSEKIDIIVKSDLFEHLCQEFGAGLYGLLDLIGDEYSNEWMFFVFNPGKYIVQYKPGIIINIFQEWLDENKQPIFEFLQKIIILRNEYHLQLDFVLYDALSNTFLSTFFWQSGISDKNIVNSWVASDNEEIKEIHKYIPNFESENELKEAVEKEVEETAKEREHPIFTMIKMIMGEKTPEDFDDDYYEEDEESIDEMD
ncbi:MAG: hypothetical protein ACTSYY_09880 [Promethearchaeota archaeon]